MTAERGLPMSLDAERAVLGSVLMNRDAIVPVALALKSEDFYVTQHGTIYAAMLKLYAARTPADTRTVAEELRRTGQLDGAGGVQALTALVNAVPTSQHASHYAAQVAELALRRRGIAAGAKIAGLFYDETDTTQDTIAAAFTTLEQAVQRPDATQSLVSLTDTYSEVYDWLTGDGPPALPSGLTDYDRITGGLWPGELVIPAARPGHGKSSLLNTIALHPRPADAGAIIWFSKEMSREQIAMRRLAAMTQIPLDRLRRRRLDSDQLGRVIAAMNRPPEPIHLSHVKQTVAEMLLVCQQFRAQHGPIAVVLVDYLQIVKPATSAGKGSNRTTEVDAIAQDLKDMALKLGVPVVAPAQLNRNAERVAVPTLADLREAGNIEQAADVVLFLVRPELLGTEGRTGEADAYIGKHRNGEIGHFKLVFDGPATRFCDHTSRIPAVDYAHEDEYAHDAL